MGWEPLHPTVELADGIHEDGTIWRSEVTISGRLVDATVWCDSPARASQLGRTLAGQWNQFRRWIPDAQLDLVPDPQDAA